MPYIEVHKPFGLRLGSKAPVRRFEAGIHQVSPEELAHWFVRACLADGRAVLLDGEENDERAAESLNAGAAQETEAWDEPETGEQDDSSWNEALADALEDDPGPLEPVTKDHLMDALLEDLKKLARECNIEVPARATKSQIADLILEGAGGCILRIASDGYFIDKAAPSSDPVQEAE